LTKKQSCATIDSIEQAIIAAIEKKYGKEIPYGKIEYFLVEGKVDHLNKNNSIKLINK